MKWGLTDEQIKARSLGLGGSDARIVVHGTPEERYRLWQEKIGEKKSVKILSDWQAAWRHATETLQLDWFEHVHDNNRMVTRRGESVVHPEHTFMRCTLDGFVEPERVPINAKHVSRWTKEARQWCIDHYTPQMTHEALVCGSRYGLLSLIHDEKEPEIIRIDVDPFYAEDMIEREAEFWRCVVERVPPPDGAELDTPKVAVEVKRLRTFDVSAAIGSEEWKRLVAQNNWLVPVSDAVLQFAETLAAQKANGAARTAIKELLPADIGVFTMPTKVGVYTGKRSSAGDLTMTVKKDGE